MRAFALKSPAEKKSRCESGFTLIELLVVVSIIALLIAILLPSLGKARSRARTAACGANLHGWMNASFVWMAANDNALFSTSAPPISFTDSTGATVAGNSAWYSVLVSGVNSNITPQIAYANSTFAPYVSNMKALVCPEMADGTMPVYQYWTTPWMPFNSYGIVSFGSVRPQRFSNMTIPAETLGFADGLYWDNIFNKFECPYIFSANSGGTPGVQARHNKMANAAWYDGHVSVENVYQGTDAPNRIGWPLSLQNNMGYLTPLTPNAVGNTFTATTASRFNYYNWVDKGAGL